MVHHTQPNLHHLLTISIAVRRSHHPTTPASAIIASSRSPYRPSPSLSYHLPSSALSFSSPPQHHLLSPSSIVHPGVWRLPTGVLDPSDTTPYSSTSLHPANPTTSSWTPLPSRQLRGATFDTTKNSRRITTPDRRFGGSIQ